MPCLHLQHLLNVLVQIANKMGFLKKKCNGDKFLYPHVSKGAAKVSLLMYKYVALCSIFEDSSLGASQWWNGLLPLFTIIL
jgi:hypothetical protein